MKRSHAERLASRGVSYLRRILFLGPHTCPWWLGYTFDNPVRRLFHDPYEILSDYISPGQTVLDIGCGMGYFSLALAKQVGHEGKVIALDVQSQMIEHAKRRAESEGLADRIEFRICSPNHLGIKSHVDFVLAFWVIHEVEDPKRLFEEVQSILNPDGNFLIVEPKGHVSAARFENTINLMQQIGYRVKEGPKVKFSRSIICSPIRQFKPY